MSVSWSRPCSPGRARRSFTTSRARTGSSPPAGARGSAASCCSIRPIREVSAYNPLLEVRRGDREVRDVQNVADILVDPEGALERRNHWEKTSHSLLVGAILHVLYAEADKTLAGVANFLSDPRRPIESTLRAMMTTPHLGDQPHPVVASAARELLNKSENERSGVLSTAMSFLGLYRDPVVAKVTRRCDWRIADLVADATTRRRSTSSCRPPTSAGPSRWFGSCSTRSVGD